MTSARRVHRIAQVAELIGMSDDFVRDEIKAGHLRARKLGKFTVVTDAELSRYLTDLPATDPAPMPKAVDAVQAEPARIGGHRQRVERRVTPIGMSS